MSFLQKRSPQRSVIAAGHGLGVPSPMIHQHPMLCTYIISSPRILPQPLWAMQRLSGLAGHLWEAARGCPLRRRIGDGPSFAETLCRFLAAASGNLTASPRWYVREDATRPSMTQCRAPVQDRCIADITTLLPRPPKNRKSSILVPIQILHARLSILSVVPIATGTEGKKCRARKNSLITHPCTTTIPPKR